MFKLLQKNFPRSSKTHKKLRVHGAQTEVRQLDVAAAGEQQILWLDVAMYEALGVDVTKRENNLHSSEHNGCRRKC